MKHSLSRIWDLRHQGDTLAAQDAYLSICHSLKLAPDASVRDQIDCLQKLKEKLDIVDFLCLEASFLRRQLKMDESEQRLNEIESQTQALGLPPHFQFFFQRGLNALVLSNYSRGLDAFFMARRYARDAKEYHLSFIDMILCLEELGSDYSRQLAQFEMGFWEHAESPWARTILGQFYSLKFRAAYRRGDLSEIQKTLAGGIHGEEQSYLYAWTLSLPCFQFEVEAGLLKSLEQWLYDHWEGYLVPYRIRTLQGLLIEEDLHCDVRLPVRIERLYLWVWQWLTNPEPARLEKIFLLKSNIDEVLRSQLSSQDCGLLENALRWLGLFLGLSERSLRSQMGQWVRSWTPLPPPLEYERGLLDYLYALRDGNLLVANDTLTVLKKHPMAKAPHFLLHQLSLSVAEEIRCPAAFKVLCESLRDLLGSEANTDTPSVVVNLLSKHIHSTVNPKKRVEIRSSSISHLLYSFKDRRSVHVAEVLQNCFQLVRYDPLIHDPKLANLLNRANRLMGPELRFSRKELNIFLTGDVECLSFQATNVHTMQMARNGEHWERLILPKHRETKIEIAPVTTSNNGKLPSGWLNREDIQSFLGVSRTSTIRKLNSWLKQKRVQRRGVGKASRYRLTQELEQELFDAKEAHYL